MLEVTVNIAIEAMEKKAKELGLNGIALVLVKEVGSSNYKPWFKTIGNLVKGTNAQLAELVTLQKVGEMLSKPAQSTMTEEHFYFASFWGGNASQNAAVAREGLKALLPGLVG